MLRRRQSTRHTHVADRQMTEAAKRGEIGRFVIAMCELQKYRFIITSVRPRFIFVENGKEVLDDIAAFTIA